MLAEPGQEPTEEELIRFCRDGLPAFERPRRVVFVEGYPTTSTGNIRRGELRERTANLLRVAAPPP